MARPRGRNGGRGAGRGGTSGRGRGTDSGGRGRSSRGGARGSARGGYSSGRAGAGGPNPAALMAVIGGGAVIVIVLLVVLLSRGGDPDFEDQAAKAPETQETVTDPNRPPPPKPLTEWEYDQIKTLINELAKREKEVIRLKDLGFEAHNQQRYDEAQRYWHEANDMLNEMIRESNELFTEIGEDRVDEYADPYYAATGKWGQIKAEFTKYLK